MPQKQANPKRPEPLRGIRGLKVPSVGLEKAIGSLKTIYGRESRSSITRDVVAEHMGYKSSAGGAAMRALADLFKYGLLEGQGSQIIVSDLGARVAVCEEGTPEYARAVKEAAEKPALFAKLNERSKGGPITDRAVESYLQLDLKFSKKSAESAARVYRQTRKFLEAALEGIDPGALGEEDEGEGTRQEDEAVTGPGADKPRMRLHASPMGGYAPPLEKGVEREVYILEEGRVELTFPKNLSPASAGDLAGYLEVFIKKANRMANPKDPTSEGSEDENSTDARSKSPTDAGGGDDEN